MKIDALSRLERHAKRIAEIAAVLGKYGLADLFGGFFGVMKISIGRNEPFFKTMEGSPALIMNPFRSIESVTEGGAASLTYSNNFMKTPLPVIGTELTKLIVCVGPKNEIFWIPPVIVPTVSNPTSVTTELGANENAPETTESAALSRSSQ